jgi:hypothetical protein
MLSHSDVIAAFGGVRPLAEAIGVDPKRAIHWAQRGIPAKYWPLVEDVAVGKGILITARALWKLPANVQPHAGEPV